MIEIEVSLNWSAVCGWGGDATMNIFRSRVDVFEAINRCDWQKVKDAVVPGKVREEEKRGMLWSVPMHVPCCCFFEVSLRATLSELSYSV